MALSLFVAGMQLQAQTARVERAANDYQAALNAGPADPSAFRAAGGALQSQLNGDLPLAFAAATAQLDGEDGAALDFFQSRLVGAFSELQTRGGLVGGTGQQMVIQIVPAGGPVQVVIVPEPMAG
jgi:hypothetical protein